jgi:hypothetical protein
LYCGKEIGAFRILRDSEFCSVAHRKKYGERLSKTLHDIAAPEPPPAGIAPFRDQMPLQTGNCAPGLRLFQRVHLQDTRIPRLWTLNLDLSDPGVSAAVPTPVAVPQSAPSHPPMVKTWMAAPGADPIEAFLPTSASLVAILASRAPRFALGLEPNLAIDQARHFPALCEMIESVPAAEPVCAFVQASSHAVAIHTVPALRVAAKLAFAAEIDRAAHAPSMSTTWEASPAPEPVAAFVRASQSTELVAAPHTLQLPYFTAEFEPTSELDTVVTPDPCGAWMPSPAAEPVAAFLQTSTAPAHAFTGDARGTAPIGPGRSPGGSRARGPRLGRDRCARAQLRPCRSSLQRPRARHFAVLATRAIR